MLIKAWHGGGGKGMKIVQRREEMEEAVLSAQREALNAFGNSNVLVERYLVNPRHVEVQIFGDQHQNYVYLWERDCSVQRRHQKVIEEAPAPHLDLATRQRLGETAVAAARAVGYYNAGTVEFIASQDLREFYFMEMNTRLQVEHPVTEMITEQDLVEWQLRVAAGETLPLRQENVPLVGHAFEARIYAEDPRNGFLPSTGPLRHLHAPSTSRHLRVDTGVRQGDQVTVYYDPMIAKLIVHGADRASALRRLRHALDQYRIVGVQTNLSFLKRVAAHPAFEEGQVHTGFIPQHESALFPPLEPVPPSFLAAGALFLSLQAHASSRSASATDPWDSPELAAFTPSGDASWSVSLTDNEQTIQVQLTRLSEPDTYKVRGRDGKEMRAWARLQGSDSIELELDGKHEVFTCLQTADELHLYAGTEHHVLTLPQPSFRGALGRSTGDLLAPMPGKIVKVMVKPGDAVEKGTPLLILEAMKMEHVVRAPATGRVVSVHYNVGDLVELKKLLISMETNSAAAPKSK